MNDFDDTVPETAEPQSLGFMNEDAEDTCVVSVVELPCFPPIPDSEDASSAAMPWDSVPCSPVEPVSSRKHGSILVPILLTLAVFLVGLSVYWMDNFIWSKVSFPDSSEASIDPIAEETESVAYLTVDNGTLCFLPDAFPGGVIRIPNSIDGTPVTSIPDNCFRGCPEVTMIIIDPGVTTIGSNAFSMCKKLRGVSLPSTVVSIGAGAFRDDKSLEAVLVSSGCESIGESAFTGCDHLHFIFYLGNHEKWNQLYAEQINPFAYISCYDGYFPQNGG